MFSLCIHLKLGHRFHALLKVCSDRDDTVPLIRDDIVHHAFHETAIRLYIEYHSLR